MKRINLFAYLLSTCLASCGQNEKQFDIKEEITSDSSLKKTKTDFNTQNLNLFEDETYFVSKTCSGEWGGSIKFKNKITGTEYSCSATCPVAVNKIEGKYFVTNSLAHMSGFTEILQIDNPDSMEIFKLPEQRESNGTKIARLKVETESHSTKGTKILADSTGILTIASFPYKGQIFHIITDFQKTFLSKIDNRKFVPIDTISNVSIWDYNQEVIKTSENHFMVFFNNDKTSGYLDIFENKIHLTRYK